MGCEAGRLIFLITPLVKIGGCVDSYLLRQAGDGQKLSPQPPIVLVEHPDSRGGRVFVSLQHPVGKGYAAYSLNSRVHMVSLPVTFSPACRYMFA